MMKSCHVLYNQFSKEPNAADQKIGRGEGMTGRFEVATGLQRLFAVNRKGGGHGGGHAGGRSTGTGAHGGEDKGNGDAGATHGSTVVPVYAAGAMNHHQYNSHHHGSNEGSPNYAVSSCLVLVALAVILLEYFA